MQKIIPTNVNVKAHGTALNALAVNKRSYPLYFYIDTTKDLGETADLPATDAEIELTIVTGSGLSQGDYFRIGNTFATMEDEILKVKAWLTGDTVMLAERAQMDTDAETHTKDDSVFIQQDGFVNTQLGAGTATIVESRGVWDLADASFYDLDLEVKCYANIDESADTIVLNYAFSGFDDLDLGATATTLLETQLADGASTLSCLYPDGTANKALYYSTGNIKPTARYMYVWVTGSAGLDDAATTAKFRINTV